MKKMLIIPVLVIILQLFATGAASASGVDLEYTITIEHPENRNAHVKLTVSNIDTSMEHLHLEIYRSYYQPEYSYVKNLAVTSEKGSIYSDIQAENQRWICDITTENADNVTIEYDTEQLVPSSTGGYYKSYICSDYAIIDGRYLFFIPSFSTISDIKVNFNLPGGWDALVVWDKKDNWYDVDWYNSLKRYMALGPFTKSEGTKNNVKITVASPTVVIPSVTLEEWLGGIKQLTEFYDNVFGFVPMDRSLWITAPSPMTTASMQGNTFVIRSTTSGGFWERTAFEYSRAWLGGVVFFDNSAGWFVCGGADFFADMALYNTNLSSKSGLDIFDDWTWYVSVRGTSADEAIAGATSTNTFYNKGKLVTYLLNKEIEDVTSREKNIYDLAKYLTQNCQGKVLGSDDLLEAVNTVTGENFSDFFSKYVYGTEELPVEELGLGELSVPTMPEVVQPPASTQDTTTALLIAIVVMAGLVIIVYLITRARRKAPKLSRTVNEMNLTPRAPLQLINEDFAIRLTCGVSL